MTKTYELSNERMIMADVDEIHHTATISVYVLDDLVKEANKADVLEQISDEIAELKSNNFYTEEVRNGLGMALDVIANYRG